jgi:serine/threonine protein kinase
VEELFEFGVHEQDGQSSDATPHQYCVAVELPSLTLDRVVVSMLENQDYKRNPDMRNRYFSKVCMVLRLIAKSIRHLHEVGVVHGDVCLGNCGKFDDKWKLMSSLGTQPIGKRFDSARMGESSPPEAVEMLRNVVETRGQETASRRAAFKGDIVAAPAVDMWAFGKLIYEVLTGEPLIQFDPNKDTRHDNRALLKLVSWNEDDLQNVVDKLQDSGVSTLGIDLVSHCLLPDPGERPSTMDEILDHPFWKDIRQKGVMARRSNSKARQEI